MAIPDYVEKEDVLNILKEFVPDDEEYMYDWDSIIENGRICNGTVNGVEGCYGYEMKGFAAHHESVTLTVFIHPFTGTEVWYDPVHSLNELGL